MPPPRRRARTGAAPVVHAPSVVVPGARLGLDTVVGAFCFVADGAVIGDGTRLQSHVSVWAGVTLGEDVFVGPAATFTNVRHPRAAFPRAPRWDRTVVEDGASIGANATIVAPVRIGRCALVGAGAVVTREVPPHAIVVGAPARVVGWACTCGETVARGARPPKRAECNECGRVLVRVGAGDRAAIAERDDARGANAGGAPDFDADADSDADRARPPSAPAATGARRRSRRA